MAKSPNVFGGGGGGADVATIEAISGEQAHVAEDFVVVPFGTVNHEHGERRVIQNQANNLKSSSGIERISFNGIDELDTEQGPNGERVYALNTGDSRIRFIDGLETWQFFVDTNSAGTQPGPTIRTRSESDEQSGTELMGSVEITFFGTALNILSWTDTGPTNWLASVDGGTATQVGPNNNTINLTNPAQFDVAANRNTKVNQVVPIVSGLTAGIHTVKIDGRRHGQGAGAGGSQLPLFGCEIINESSDIVVQPGADFSSNISLDARTNLPIKPGDAGINSRSEAIEAFTGTTGARVINYLTSSGELKQVYDIADEAPVVQAAGEQEYNIEIQNGGSTSVTLPISTTSFITTSFGSGGGGGGGGGITPLGTFRGAAGGGGGGAGKSGATFTRTTSTQAETLTLVVPGTAAGGFGLINAGGSQSASGAVATIVTNSTTITSAPGGGNGATGVFFGSGGAGGAGGAAGTSQSFTGWSIASEVNTEGTSGGGGGSDNRTPGGNAGNVGGFGITPLTGNEGAGGTGGVGVGSRQDGTAGTTPGGAGGGGNAGDPGFLSAGGTGAAGRIYLTITAASGLIASSFGVVAGEFTAGAATGADLGAATAVFGNAAFDTNRLNQEVVRRINFREFGANNQFATLAGSNSNRAFTLDDGTTTLVGNGVFVHPEGGKDGVTIPQETGTLTLTFVGTGLDITNNRSASLAAHNVLVDGFSIGTLSGVQPVGVIPIVSGLAYGTHTVRFALQNASLERLSVVDFIIYGPKRPEIPEDDEGSLELADYNVMADFDADASNNINSVSKGSLGKAVARECILNNGVSGTGRWSTELSTDGNSYGSRLNETGDGSTREELFYTFYGDAFSMRMKSNTANSASNHEFYLDGTQITRTNTEGWDVDEVIFLNNTNNGTSDPSQTWPATGDVTRFDGSDTTKIIFPPSFNMGLGVHTIRIRHAGNSPGIFYGMEIGTPIHINEDSLKIGSTGLNNLTIDPVVEEDERQVQNLGEAKAWVHYSRDNPSSTILGSYNISAIIQNSTSTFTIFLDKPFKDKGYAVVATARDNGSSTNVQVQDEGPASSTQPRANFFTINCEQAVEGIYVACFGELIDE